jgi:hypothetical protein
MGSLAIYWDFENIHASLGNLRHDDKNWYRRHRGEAQPEIVQIEVVMEYAASIGDVNINRAYGNWITFANYAANLQRHAIDLVQLFDRGPHGKNGADIRLAIDVIDDVLRHDQIGTVLVVGGDSDYIAIAQRVRARGLRVVGIGVDGATNPYWIHSCTEFKLYDVLASRSAPTAIVQQAVPFTPTGEANVPLAAEPDAPMLNRRAHVLLRRAMTALTDESSSNAVKATTVKQTMLRLDPSFDQTRCGFRTFRDFLAGAESIVTVSAAQHDALVSLQGGGSGASRPAERIPFATD